MKIKSANRTGGIFDRTLDILAWVAGGLIAFAWLSVCAEVILRYFANRPQVWVVEFTEYSMVYATFLGAAWLLRKEGHVRIDVMTNFLGPRKQALLNVVTSILGVIVFLTLTWFGTHSTFAAWQDGIGSLSALQPPVWPFMAAIPVGSFLLFIQSLRSTSGYLKTWRTTSDK